MKISLNMKMNVNTILKKTSINAGHLSLTLTGSVCDLAAESW